MLLGAPPGGAQAPDPKPPVPPKEVTKVTFASSPEHPLADVDPSTFAGAPVNITATVQSVPLVVTTVTFTFNLSSSGEGDPWIISASTPDPPKLVITGSNSGTQQVVIQPPLEANLEDASTLQVHASWSTSLGESGSWESSILVGIAQYFQMSAYTTKSRLTLIAGEHKEVPLRTNNGGNGLDSYSLKIAALVPQAAAGGQSLDLEVARSQGWVLQLNTTAITLRPRESGRISVTVGAPVGLAKGTYDLYFNVSSDQTRDSAQPQSREVKVTLDVRPPGTPGPGPGPGPNATTPKPGPLPGFEVSLLVLGVLLALAISHRPLRRRSG